MPVDLDVLDVGVVDQRLQSPEAEQRGHDGLGELDLLVRRDDGQAFGERPLGVVGQQFDDDAAAQLAPAGLVQTFPAA